MKHVKNKFKVCFDQQSSNLPSGVPYCEGEKGSKMSKMINLASTGHRRSESLSNKTRQKYGLFSKFSLSVIGSCEVDKNPHIFITRANQHIKETHRYFYGELNNYDPMAFEENQEQN